LDDYGNNVCDDGVVKSVQSEAGYYSENDEKPLFKGALTLRVRLESLEENYLEAMHAANGLGRGGHGDVRASLARYGVNSTPMGKCVVSFLLIRRIW
jgi:hypothetical protein